MSIRGNASAPARAGLSARGDVRIVRGVSGRDEYLCYTDGSCKGGGGGAGGWGFCIEPPAGPPLESYGKATGTLAKVMEYRAVAEALTALPDKATAIVFSDNQSLVENLAKNLERIGQGKAVPARIVGAGTVARRSGGRSGASRRAF